MATVRGSLNISGGLIDYVIIVLYKTTAPGTEVDRLVYEEGVSDNPFNYAFNDLENGTYIIKVHESADGSALGNLRHDYWVDAETGRVLFERGFFTVGSGLDNVPEQDDTQFAEPSLDGKQITGVFQEGYRYLIPGVEWQELAGGGFELLGGRVFDNAQTWTYEILQTVVETEAAPDDPFAEIVIISSNTTLDSSYYNKTIYGNTTNDTLVITLPNIAGVPDKKGFVIAHDGGNAINVEITGGTHRFRGADKTKTLLGKGESVRVIKKTVSGTPKWFVTPLFGQWDRIGKREGVDVVGLNMLVADGQTAYDGTVYKRIYEWIRDEVPVDQKVSFATFDTTATINGEAGVYTKRGFFAIDTVAQQFKLPDMRNQSLRFLKNVGGSDSTRVDNKAGGYQHWLIGNHTHGGGVAAHSGGGGYIEGYGGNNAPGSDNYDPATTGGVASGQENTTRNTGLIPVVLI